MEEKIRPAPIVRITNWPLVRVTVGAGYLEVAVTRIGRTSGRFYLREWT